MEIVLSYSQCCCDALHTSIISIAAAVIHLMRFRVYLVFFSVVIKIRFFVRLFLVLSKLRTISFISFRILVHVPEQMSLFPTIFAGHLFSLAVFFLLYSYTLCPFFGLRIFCNGDFSFVCVKALIEIN